MIILRQKEYSSKPMKLIRTAKRIGNRVMTSIDNAGLKAGEVIEKAVTGKTTPQYKKFRFRPKTSQAINRETVQQVRGAQESAKALRDSAILDPGGTVGEVINKGVIQRATRSPLSAAMPLVPIPGSTSTSLVVAPYEQKVWDRVNKAGIGRYTVGRVTKPVKEFVRGTVNRNAANVGRALYRQANILTL